VTERQREKETERDRQREKDKERKTERENRSRPGRKIIGALKDFKTKGGGKDSLSLGNSMSRDVGLGGPGTLKHQEPF
jgi:hypothetical protein